MTHLARRAPFTSSPELQVCAVDIDAGKLEHARRLGADAVVDAKAGDAIDAVKRATGGGAHGVLITAPSLAAFTVRGSFVGTRRDMAEALAFAVEGKVEADVELQPLSAINRVFDRLRHGDVEARVVLEFANSR